MTKFLEKTPGNKSLIRLLALLGFILGGVVALWGMVLLTISTNAVINGKMSAVSIVGSLVMVIVGGLTLAGGGEVMKVLQQRSEVKENEVVVENNISTGSTPPSMGGN